MFLIIGIVLALVCLFLASKYEDKAHAAFTKEDGLAGATDQQFIEAQRAYLRALRGSEGTVSYPKLYSRHHEYLYCREKKFKWAGLAIASFLVGLAAQYLATWRH